MTSAYDLAAAAIEDRLGPRTHPDVEFVLDILAAALNGQRTRIARQLSREAAEYKRSGAFYAYGNGRPALTYDGGLRRAARVLYDCDDGA